MEKRGQTYGSSLEEQYQKKDDLLAPSRRGKEGRSLTYRLLKGEAEALSWKRRRGEAKEGVEKRRPGDYPRRLEVEETRGTS